jgi:hypothetical protein
VATRAAGRSVGRGKQQLDLGQRRGDSDARPQTMSGVRRPGGSDRAQKLGRPTKECSIPGGRSGRGRRARGRDRLGADRLRPRAHAGRAQQPPFLFWISTIGSDRWSSDRLHMGAFDERSKESNVGSSCRSDRGRCPPFLFLCQLPIGSARSRKLGKTWSNSVAVLISPCCSRSDLSRLGVEQTQIGSEPAT